MKKEGCGSAATPSDKYQSSGEIPQKLRLVIFFM
jgi:hypothetical protein